MSGYGFKKIYNLAGGIAAWEGPAAEGPVALNLELISGDETPIEMIKLSYGMEVSVGHFYRKINDMTSDRELGELVKKLASIEDRHKDSLVKLLLTLDGGKDAATVLESHTGGSVMEGGFNGEELIEKNRSLLEDITAVLELAMMLETQALDLYLRFAEKSADPETKKVLFHIADEEKQHLEALGRLLEERV